MALDKGVAVVDAWAAVALGAVREGAEIDVSVYYDAIIGITCALGGTTAHLGTEIVVELNLAASGNANWRRFSSVVACVATAFKSDFAGDAAAGQTVLSVTNPATGNLDHLFKNIFILNGADVTHSEIGYLVAQSGDAGDTITVQNGLTFAQTSADSDVYTCDGANVSAVYSAIVAVPPGAKRARILYNNGYGATGSTVYTCADISGITAV